MLNRTYSHHIISYLVLRFSISGLLCSSKNKHDYNCSISICNLNYSSQVTPITPLCYRLPTFVATSAHLAGNNYRSSVSVGWMRGTAGTTFVSWSLWKPGHSFLAHRRQHGLLPGEGCARPPAT